MIPGMAAGMAAKAGSQIIGGLTGIAGGIIGGGKRRREQREAQIEFDRNKARYENLDTSNLATGLENAYEDLTVNTQQAEFASRRAEQSQVNLLSSLRDAAGSSGIASLAQALANQNMLRTQKISADIAKQEGANRLAAAKGNLSVQLAERKGEAMLQSMNASKQSTLLGIQQALTGQAAGNLGQAGANQASANLYANQLRSQASQNYLTALKTKGVQKFLTSLDS